MTPIRVFVVDDHLMIRRGVSAMLAGERGLTVVGEAEDGLEALRLAPPLLPDLVLVDLVMPRMDGVATICALRALLPKAQFLALAADLLPHEPRRALGAGAAGLVLKSASVTELVTAVRQAQRGERVVPSKLLGLLVTERGTALGSDLTHRERELLGMMARGLSNLEIATQLGIAMPTVKFHVTNILTKLHAENRTGAVLAALRTGIVSLE